MSRFRSSPFVELKRLADLSAEQREPFRELDSDPDFHGLFVPKPPLSMNLKSVGRETAELFQSLAVPASLDADDDIIDLVLDGILEIEGPAGFVSGADALPLISRWEPCTGPAVPPVDRNLAHHALLHAQDLETGDCQALTTALYLYNRIPLSPFWKTRFASREAILEQLGTGRGTMAVLLGREWIVTTPDRPTGWLSWCSKSSVPRDAGEVTYKLYVSPQPERIRDAFEILVRVLSAFPRVQFKIGDSAAGLLRPDKLVAYFSTREDLDEAAAELRRELAGCEAHGVPFTAALDDTGLLSWGIDPPDDDRALQWLGQDSWRYWVVKRLGAAMAVAKLSRGGAVEPWQFAIARARRHGVDVVTWIPSAALWSRA